MKSQVAVLVMLAALPLSAQTPSVFSSGSDGSDGDLIYDASKPTVVFDPNDKTQFPNRVDKDHNNVFNFKTISIPAGVHVILRADKVNGPVYFLAQNDVMIGGWLDLNGDDGASGGLVTQTSALPGPGGFYGGRGGDNASRPPSNGLGPAGGKAGDPTTTGNVCGAGDGRYIGWAGGGGYTGDVYLVPLIGGSGGGGEYNAAPYVGSGGGAGGGAILIASSGTININQGSQITAHGGGS